MRFHAVYWPAFLWSAGVELPKRVFAHGFLFNRGEKMSKSVGNVVDPFALVEHYGLDQVRYFFLREVPFGQDGNYSHEAIVNRTNADLANDLGNLAQRSLSMIAKNCDGLVPKRGALLDADKAILDMATAALGQARKAMAEQAIHVALAAVFGVVAEANRYFAGQEPWALRKSDPARMETVLHTTAETIRRVAILCQPYIPGSAAKLLDLLAVPADERSFADVADADALVAGTKLPAPRAGVPALCRADGRAGVSVLVDSHCHLDFPDFAEERDAVIARAVAAGVGRMVTISTRVKRFAGVLEIAEAHDEVYCSVGTHPHNAAEELDVTTDELVRLAAHPKVVAIGEAGLDYHYDKSPRDAQAQGFRTHIAAARETGLPLVIHARSADDDIAAILEEESGKGAFPFILHCFSSGRRLAGGRRGARRLRVLLRHPHLQELRRAARHRRRCAARPAAGRDRRALSRAGAVPRQAQRTVLRDQHRARSRRNDRRRRGDEIAAITTDNFFRLFNKMPRQAEAGL